MPQKGHFWCLVKLTKQCCMLYALHSGYQFFLANLRFYVPNGESVSLCWVLFTSVTFCSNAWFLSLWTAGFSGVRHKAEGRSIVIQWQIVLSGFSLLHQCRAHRKSVSHSALQGVSAQPLTVSSHQSPLVQEVWWLPLFSIGGSSAWH